MNNTPLVSVVIVTYNSSKYILETLKSVYEQTYQNIELIITDDSSKDNTVDICMNWVINHQNRFARTEILTNKINTGVSINIKRGIDVCKGFYIKSLAGDDCLMRNAIDEYVKFMGYSKAKMCVCDLIYIDEYNNQLPTSLGGVYETYLANLSKNLNYQKEKILEGLFIPGPGSFLTRDLYELIKDYAFRYPFADEWPYFFYVIYSGNKIYPLNKKLVQYRIHHSLCRGNSNGLINRKVFLDSKRFFNDVVSKILLEKRKYLIYWDMIIHYCVIDKLYDNSNTPYKLLNLLNPYWYKRLVFKK